MKAVRWTRLLSISHKGYFYQSYHSLSSSGSRLYSLLKRRKQVWKVFARAATRWSLFIYIYWSKRYKSKNIGFFLNYALLDHIQSTYRSKLYSISRCALCLFYFGFNTDIVWPLRIVIKQLSLRYRSFVWQWLSKYKKDNDIVRKNICWRFWFTFWIKLLLCYYA